ncbi:MAG: nucleotide sugar dehydrogenase [Defluviitaleaceae bacterium]|nr:nucleotide sugar dehydrogenase [Defluviitaleaceae bacterium]
MNISIIGLGKLGLCTAACIASKGVKVYGFDINTDLMHKLKNKECPINETGLIELLEKAWSNFIVADTVQETIQKTDATLIITPTPSDSSGKFENHYITDVLKKIAPFIKTKNSFHIVDIVSTVMPGSCENEFIPLLENMTGKIAGKDFGIAYNPEFIALGSVIKNFLNPDIVLIGASDDYTLNYIKNLYLTVCENNPHIAEMSLINAEITKLSLNCYVTMKISYANELASICEKVPGADVDAVTSAIGLDTRIGQKCLKAGLGFGGPCFPRDNAAFQQFAKKYYAETKLSKQVVSINNDTITRLYGLIEANVSRNAHIAVLGAAYKPFTHIIEESPSIHLIDKLLAVGHTLSVHDPQALEWTKNKYAEKLKYHDDVNECIINAEAVVIMTSWPEYEKIDFAPFDDDIKILIDPWRLYKNNLFKNIKYFALGACHA